MATANHLLKQGEVSAMLKLGFLPSPPPLSPPAHTTPTPQRSTTPKAPPFPPAILSSLHHRLSSILQAGIYSSCGRHDVDLSVRSSNGLNVSLGVHRRILVQKSGFFAEKLPAVAGRRKDATTHLVEIEICDCDDVEVYVEVVALMYSDDLRVRLAGESVGKVVSLLKVSAAIAFEEGVESCLEHLKAAPWSEAEEQEVVDALSGIQVYRPVSGVLERVSEAPYSSSQAAGVFARLFSGVLQARDEKARREMKRLVSKLVRSEGVCRNAADKEILYGFCRNCLNSLHSCLSEAVSAEEGAAIMGDIAREADNLKWVVEILIGLRSGEEFVELWADQKQLAALHARIPTVYRYEISKVTAQLCVAIGREQILASKEARLNFLETWLEALYEDFAWIRRSSKNLDRRAVEDGLSQTILTLPIVQQGTIPLNWFERFLSRGDDCPNIQFAFKVWWRRAFSKQHDREDGDPHSQTTVCGSSHLLTVYTPVLRGLHEGLYCYLLVLTMEMCERR